jgi:hypothetical protein
MQFTHLIQVNDPRDASIEPLTREQLWRGLVVRAEKPKYFLIGVDGCEILRRGDNMLERRVQFGSRALCDRVIFHPPLEVRYEIPATDDMPGGALAMRIEEPAPGELFLRFSYALYTDGGRVEDYYNEFRKAAYVESDIDTIRMIRQLAASGLLSEQ